MRNILDLLKKEDRNRTITKSFKKDEVLFNEEEKCEYLAVVISGEIIIHSTSISGQEIIYNTLKSGEMFGNNLIFSSHPYYRGVCLSKKNSTVSFISKKDLLYILSNNDAFLESYLSYQADFSKKLNFQIKLLSLSSAEERFIYYLKQNNNQISFESVSNLAKKIFLTREVLSRLITKLKNQGIIKRKDKEIYLLAK